MEVPARIETGGHSIEFGVATTREEREAVLAQRFRAFQREGYFRKGLRDDRDEYDREAVYFLGRLKGAGRGRGVLVGSTRLIEGREDSGFEFPALEVPVRQRGEVARVVAEQPPGIRMGRLTTVLGLILAIAEYAERTTLRCGLAVIKRWLLDALEASGPRFHEICGAQVVYARDGPVSGYFYAHPDPAALIYWFADEVGPAVREILRLRREVLMAEAPAAPASDISRSPLG